jgi:hypothetical protein
MEASYEQARALQETTTELAARNKPPSICNRNWLDNEEMLNA